MAAVRSGEVRGARRDEIAGDVWTVPANRMKAGRPHRSPLSPAAMAIIEEMRKTATGAFVFPGGQGGRTDQPLSRAALGDLLRRMGRSDCTVHGFRASLRTWVGERTTFPAEVAEMQLAHVNQDRTESAYARGDLLEKRARLMAAWGRHRATPPKAGLMVPIRRA